jgi:hypothetical protein
MRSAPMRQSNRPLERFNFNGKIGYVFLIQLLSCIITTFSFKM